MNKANMEENQNPSLKGVYHEKDFSGMCGRHSFPVFRTLDPVEVISAQIFRNIKSFELIAAF